jgi:DNA-directed RNA polymerase specialized sigma24 family protein
MAVQFRWSATPDEDAEDPASADWSTFTDIFREYAAYIFEYCVKLLNDEGEAAGATTVTFITAQALLDHLEDYDRLEAWLYALARRECTSKHPARSEKAPEGFGFGAAAAASRPGASAGAHAHGAWPAAAGGAGTGQDQPAIEAGAAAEGAPAPSADDALISSAGAETEELSALTRTSERRISARKALSAFSRLAEEDREVLAAFSALSSRDREVLDLVYWHGLSPLELPAILDVPPLRAQTLLAEAVRRFREAAEDIAIAAERSGQEPEGSGDKLAAVVPVARMPSAVWRRASRALFDPDLRGYRDAVIAHVGRLRPDGFPAQRTAPGARAQTLKVTAAVVLPAAAVAVLLVYLAGSSSGGTSPGLLALTPDGPSTAAGAHQSGSAPGSAQGHAKAHHGALPITSLFPGHPSQGVLPIPSPTNTNGSTPTPGQSSVSSSAPTSSQPSSITQPPPSKSAKPTPSPTKASPTPTISNPSPTPTSPSPTSSGSSASSGSSTSS